MCHGISPRVLYYTFQTFTHLILLNEQADSAAVDKIWCQHQERAVTARLGCEAIQTLQDKLTEQAEQWRRVFLHAQFCMSSSSYFTQENKNCVFTYSYTLKSMVQTMSQNFACMIVTHENSHEYTHRYIHTYIYTRFH